jgi:hypothetical protein
MVFGNLELRAGVSPVSLQMQERCSTLAKSEGGNTDDVFSSRDQLVAKRITGDDRQPSVPRVPDRIDPAFAELRSSCLIRCK